MKKTIVKRAIQIAIAVLGTGAFVYAMVPDPLPVEIAPAGRGAIEVTVDGEGKTRVRERHIVSAPVTGQLARIDLDPGTPVTVGAPLATITPTEPPLLDARSRAQAEASRRLALAGRAQAKSRIEAAEAALTHARAELGRARALHDAGSLARAAFEAAELHARTAAADMDAARFAHKMAQSEVETAEALLKPGPASGLAPIVLRAPIDGLVLRVFHESAGPVTPGAPLVELGDPGALEVVMDLLSSDAVAVPPGARVELEGWGGDRPLEARVRRIEPAATTKVSPLGIEEQRVDVVADITSPRDAWLSLGDGYRVHASVTVKRSEDALGVPLSALFRRGDRWAVFVMDGGRARLREVELGNRSRERAEVLSGLAEGERVIVHPSDKLQDGSRIASR